MDYRQQSPLCIRTLTFMMGFLMFLPTLGSATDFVIIGGSEPQKRLVSCIAEASMGLFRHTPGLHVLADRDTALWGVGHELGHFMIPDGIEGHAEFAAVRIRWRARQTCGSITQ